MISLNTSSNNRLRLMRSLWLVVIGASFTPGCKTTGSGLKDQSKDSPEIGYHCSFTSPRDVAEVLQVWATPNGPSQLQNVHAVYSGSDGKGSFSQTLASPPAVGGDVITKTGSRELRVFFKSLLDVKFTDYTCLDLNGSPNAMQANYFCFSKTINPSKVHDALWITNQSSQKFGSGLTVYQTACVDPK